MGKVQVTVGAPFGTGSWIYDLVLENVQMYKEKCGVLGLGWGVGREMKTQLSVSFSKVISDLNWAGEYYWSK